MTIYLDPYRLLLPNGAFEINDEPSYVEARRRIVAYFQGISALSPNFVVHEYPYLAWFEDVPTWLIRISPRSRLIEKYPQAIIPPNLTDTDIISLELINVDIEPTVAALTKHFFGTLLDEVELTASTLLALSRFVGKQPELFQKRYLKQVWHEKLSALPEALLPLREADKDFCQALSEGIYMGGIPTLVTDWEYTHAVNFKTTYGITLKTLIPYVRWSVRTFPDDPVLESLLIKKLLILLKENIADDQTQNPILPGLYRAEVEAILRCTSTLTTEQLHHIERKYADLLTSEVLYRLQRLVPPTLEPIPTLVGLSLTNQAEAWRKWAVESYIPYKFWLDGVANPQPSQLDSIELLATQYGDWLFDNNAALLALSDVPTIYGIIRQVRELLEVDNNAVIWFIIDGFPAAFVPILEQILHKHGLIRQMKQYAFAALPTITEVGIPAQLGGITPDSSAFTEDRSMAINQAFPGYTTTFTSVVNKFQDALDIEADLCCLHWQGIDQLMHKDDNEFDNSMARIEAIRDSLNERIGKLANAINYRTDRPTKLIISTDHGATKCLQNGMNIKNAKLNEAAVATRERSVRLDGKLLTVHLDEKETYYLTPDITRNPTAYVSARGYRYFGKNDRGYRHGGLTPEETVIPILMAQMAAFAVKPIQISYYGGADGLEQGKTIKGFVIQVQNPNAFAIEVLTLTIKEDPNADFNLPTNINPSSKNKLTATIKIAQRYKAQNGQLMLSVSITYRAQAEVFREHTVFPVPIKTSEIDDFDFGDL